MLPRSNDTLSPDKRLRSPAHILASLSADTVPDARADRRQRRKPRPSVGSHPRDHAIILDWTTDHGRIFALEDLQVGLLSNPSQVRAGGEHLVLADAASIKKPDSLSRAFLLFGLIEGPF